MPALTFDQILAKSKTPTGCGVLVVRRDGKILTGTRIENDSRGQICGPGGHIEPGETPRKAARREAMEEFGIICNKLAPLGTQRTNGGYGTSAVFLCTDYIGKPMTDEEEMTEPKWLTIEEIKSQNVFPPFMRSLKLLPETVRKFNPNHDKLGRFSSGPGGGAAAAGGGSPSFLDENGDFDPFAALMWGAEHPDEIPERPKENWEKPYQMVEGKDLLNGSREERERVADMRIEEVLKEQGFDGKPKVVTTMDEFSKAVQENGNISCRGISASSQEAADAYVDQLKNGEFFVECKGGSAMGRGMYMASAWGGVTDYDTAFEEADRYASGLKTGRVVNMTLDKSAKTISLSDLYDLAYKDGSSLGSRTLYGYPGPNSLSSKVRDDMGAFAAAKGYDAIVGLGGITVVLNRTKLVILDQTGDIRYMDGGDDLLYGDWDMPAFLRGE